MKIYGWYSLKAFRAGEIEYMYLNTENQDTFCIYVSYDKSVPMNLSKYDDYFFCGELLLSNK